MNYFISFLLLFQLVYRAESNQCPIYVMKADCSHRHLDNVPQKLNSNISELDLAGNIITELQNEAFKRYTNLTSLYLDDNDINVIQINAFSGLEILKNLTLSRNRLCLIKSYVDGVFKPLIELVNLDIRKNMPRTRRSGTKYPFFGDLRKLRRLSLDLVSCPDFGNSGLTRATSLKVLVFDHCYVVQLLNATFTYISPTVEEVYFINCLGVRAVEANTLKPWIGLQLLSIFHSSMDLASALKLLYPFENKTMRTVEMTRVNHGYIQPDRVASVVIVTSDMMKYLQNICVGTLILAENGIVDFEPDSLLSYRYPQCLETLVFSGNRFALFDGFKVDELFAVSLKLSNLSVFDFSYNPLSYKNIEYTIKLPHEYSFLRSDAAGKHEIRKRTKSSASCFKPNKTTTKHRIPQDDFVFFPLPPKLTTLRLSNHLTYRQIGKHIVLLHASNLRHLDVSYFNGGSFPEISVNDSFNIEYVDFSGISSWTKSSSIMKNSKTVVLRFANISALAQERKYFFSCIPSVETLDISGNFLWQLRTDTFAKNKHLTSLILSNNLFNALPTAILEITKLTYLDSRGNILDTINETIRNWIDKRQKENGSFQLYLHGNVFRCTCETLDFIQWLSKTNVTFDNPNNEFRCTLKNGSVATTTQVLNDFHRLFSYCQSGMWLRIGIGLLVSFIVCVVPVAIVINFKWQIAYWLYCRFRKIVQNEMKLKFEYDIYVSYSDDSIFWLKNILLPKMEKSWGMKTCLLDRDILAGDIRVDAISNGIHQSKHVLFVLTDAFVDKELATFEIERAKYEKYSRYLQSIIVINKQIAVDNVPMELGKIWDDVVHINWSEDENENQWDKLYIVLHPDLI